MPPTPRALKFRSVGAPIVLRTASQLEFALDKLTTRAARSGPMMLELHVPDVGFMRIGVGLSKSVLTFRPVDGAKKGKGAIKHTISHNASGDPDHIVYWTWCEDHRHGYDGTTLIRVTQAAKGLTHFFKTGELDPDLYWKEYKPGVV